MHTFTSADASRVCRLLADGRTDPDSWTMNERASVTRLHGYRTVNPMDGAIERVLTNDRFRGYDDIHLALNEAYRNGMRSSQDDVSVEIDGLPASTEEGGYGRWVARRIGETDVFRLDGDVKAAVLEEHKCSYPETGEQAWVLIPDLRAPKHMEGDPHEKIEYWRATNFGPPYGPVQLRIDDPRGTPGAVAVGRFKASLRKFLGID